MRRFAFLTRVETLDMGSAALLIGGCQHYDDQTLVMICMEFEFMEKGVSQSNGFNKHACDQGNF